MPAPADVLASTKSAFSIVRRAVDSDLVSELRLIERKTAERGSRPKQATAYPLIASVPIRYRPRRDGHNCCHVQYSSLFVFWVAYRTRSRRRQTDGPAGEFLRREPTGDRPCALRGIGVSEPEVPQTHCDRALAWPGNNFRRRSSAERGGQPANGPVAFREVIGGDRL